MAYKDEPGARSVREIPACVEFGTRAAEDGRTTDCPPISSPALNWQTVRRRLRARLLPPSFIGAALTNSLINQPDHRLSIWHRAPETPLPCRPPASIRKYNPVTVVRLRISPISPNFDSNAKQPPLCSAGAFFVRKLMLSLPPGRRGRDSR